MLETPDNVELVQDDSRPKRTFKELLGAVPARYVLTLLAFFGFINVYALRVNLNVAMVAMVNASAIKNTVSNACPVDTNTSKAHQKDGEFVWDEYQQGIALGSFYYGYIVTQIPGGRLAELIGAKWLFGGGVLCTALLNLVTPAAAHSSMGVFIMVRVMMGLGEGVTFPAMHSMLARWMPKRERSLQATIIYSGAQIGTVLSTLISGVLCDSDFLGGWPSAFYVFGVLSSIWFIFWALLAHQTPSDHPRISQIELQYIAENQGDEQASAKPPIPWKSILTSVPVWALVITHVGQNWGFNTLLSELPTFMARIMHYDLKQNGFLSALPYLLFAIVGWTSAYFADRIRESGKVSVTVIRKVCNTISFVGPAVCLLGVTWSGCNHVATVTLLTFSVALNGFNYAGYAITHVDMSPDFAGTLMGITNGIANIPGFAAPMLAGALTKNHQTLSRWNDIFYIAFAVYVFTALVFIVLGTAELQPWGLASKEGPESKMEGVAPDDKQKNPRETTQESTACKEC